MAELKTDRLVLRPLRLQDAAAIAALTSDPGVARMTAGIPCPNPEIAAEGWILLREARAPLGVEHNLAIELPGQGLIGVIGAFRRPGETRAGWEIGYWIGRPFWGLGYATEAGAAFIAHLRAQGLTPLFASHFADNPASGRVLTKLGFIATGEVKPGYSLARAGFAPLRLVAMPEPTLAAA
jgi:RimJ/RimL family protein N-acetyltransferase